MKTLGVAFGRWSRLASGRERCQPIGCEMGGQKASLCVYLCYTKTMSRESCSWNVQGLTCGSCEQSVKAALRALPGVDDVLVDIKLGRVEVRGSVSVSEVRKTLQELGYALQDNQGLVVRRAWSWELGAWLIAFALLFAWLQRTGFSTIDPAQLQASFVFVVGFGAIASLSPCSAAIMGFLVAWQARVQQAQTFIGSLGDQMAFQGGRLLGFTFFGGVIGMLGQQLSFTVRTSGLVLLGLAFLMLLIGLDITGLLPVRASRLKDRVSSAVFARLGNRYRRSSLALFGVFSFFLPCGFAQTVQVLALASGGFWQGAALLGLFALGSLPLLMVAGLTAARARHGSSVRLMRAMGALILVMACFQWQNGWRLSGFPTSWGIESMQASNGVFVRGTYVVRIKVDGTEYSPAEARVPLGREVKLIIDGSEARGCMRSFTVPAYNIRQELTGGATEVSFTPTKLGPVNFTCAMGMGKGRVIVVPEQELGASS